MSDFLDLSIEPESSTPNWLKALALVVVALMVMFGIAAISHATYDGEKLLNERIAVCVENGGSWDGGQEDCLVDK